MYLLLSTFYNLLHISNSKHVSPNFKSSNILNFATLNKHDNCNTNGTLNYGNGTLNYGNGTLNNGNGTLNYGKGTLNYGNGTLNYGKIC